MCGPSRGRYWYYSRGFPFRGYAAAQRDAVLMAAGYLVSPPFRLPRGYVAAARSRALWWCQRAVAWWRLRRADQRRAKASRARVISPAVTCAARRVSRAVSATDSRIGAMRGGQGWPPRAGTGASLRGIRRSASLTSSPLSGAAFPPAVPAGTGARRMPPYRALRMGAWRSWARGGRAGCRQVPAQDVLARFEGFLHRPPAPGDGDEVRHGGGPVVRCLAQVEGELVRAGEQPADQQELPRAGGGGQRPVADPGSLGPGPAGAPLEDGIGDGLLSADGGAGRGGDLVVAGDDEHVGQAGFLAGLPQGTAAAVHLVGGYPPGGQPRRRQPPDLIDRELRLRSELQPGGDPGPPPPRQVTGPPLRHVHVKVRPRLPGSGDVGGEHRGHAVLHLPGAPGMLRSGARGRGAFFQLRGLVDRDARADQVTVAIRQPGGGQARQLSAQVLPVPRIRPQQGLHPAPALMTGRLRQVPAVRPGPRR